MRTAAFPIPAEAPNWVTNMMAGLTDWVQSLRTGPQVITVYSKAKLPDATKSRGGLIMVSDDVGGFTPAYSDGTNWRRTADGNIIS